MKKTLTYKQVITLLIISAIFWFMIGFISNSPSEIKIFSAEPDTLEIANINATKYGVYITYEDSTGYYYEY